MADEELVCWRCGASIASVMRPISRFAECPGCGVDLHVCRFCRFYAPKVIGECDHDHAEKVETKDKANFCGYFRPNPAAHDGTGYKNNDEARQALDALFDAIPGTAETDALMDIVDEEPAKDRARRELDQLFGLRGDAGDIVKDSS